MPYIIIVNDDNSLYGSCKRKIMQREKLFNNLCFLVAPHYNGYEMSKCTVIMRYLLPISKRFVTEKLELSNERYEDYLKYVLPIDTNLTKEYGNVELNLTFTMLDVDDNGNIVQRVRKTTNHVLKITQLPDWDNFVPDEALSALDQRILKQDAQIRALADLAIALDDNMVDNLVYDEKFETLQLSSKGIGVGNKISVRDMLDDGVPVVDLDGSSSGDESDTDTENKNGCDCGCEDNVVEFGSSSDVIVESTDNDNVVEF